MKHFLFIIVALSSFAQIASACNLQSGHEGNLLVVQYKGLIEGSFKEQKALFHEILHSQLEEQSIFEVLPDSASVSARTAKVCVSKIYGPFLVEELLQRAGFVRGNEDILVNLTN